MTHKEFMEYASDFSLNVLHITGKMVYLNLPDAPRYWWPKGVKREDDKIYNSLDVVDQQASSFKASLREAIIAGEKIPAIKALRYILMAPNPNYNPGKPERYYENPKTITIALKDAKDFIEVNFFNDPNNLKAKNNP